MEQLKQKIYTYHTDAGHGWLEVPKEDLIKAGVKKDISHCSYKDKDNYYLEEDLDAFIFLSKVFRTDDNYKEMNEHMRTVHDGDYSWIRNLQHV